MKYSYKLHAQLQLLLLVARQQPGSVRAAARVPADGGGAVPGLPAGTQGLRRGAGPRQHHPVQVPGHGGDGQ